MRWKGLEHQVSEPLELSFSFLPSIKFTIKVGGSKINFLDLTLTIIGGHHPFGIFRKKTATNTLIDGSSFCFMVHKLAAFNCYVHSLAWIPMDCSKFNEEVRILKDLCINKGLIDVVALI